MAIPTVVRLRSADQPPGKERFDYRGRHRYLVTLPTHKDEQIFVAREEVHPVLNSLHEYGWGSHFEVYAYCFLPNRLVMLIRGKEDWSDMKRFLSDFRGKTNDVWREGHGRPLWARRYLERVLRRKEESRDVALTVYNLPVSNGLIREGEEYAWRGSFALEHTDGPLRKPPHRSRKEPVRRGNRTRNS